MLLRMAAVILGLMAALAPALLALFPRIGTAPFYRLQRKRTMLLLIALPLALLDVLRRPALARVWPLAVVSGCAVLALRVLDPARAIVALDNPPKQRANHADLPGDAGVIGTEHNGEACAWPLDVLIPHHLINDHLGGEPLLVSWCAACRSGMIYRATVDGQPLDFTVVGVWRRNMVIRDAQTGSIWQQDTGACLAGPLAGRRLEPLGAELTRWAAWRADHPDSLVAEDRPEVRGLLSNQQWRQAFEMTRHFVVPGLKRGDDRLPAHAEVAGFVIDGAARAYPLKALHAAEIVNDQLGGQPLAVIYAPAIDRVRAFERTVGGQVITLKQADGDLTDDSGVMRWDQRGAPLSGTDVSLVTIPVRREWWLGWSEFYPDSAIYRAE
ncbi:MAG: DUF3179 domain-containing protein [Chloroflexi bacterium]|nr:DUF3179 domain-containing protein [Chloroflexota bacterium]